MQFPSIFYRIFENDNIKHFYQKLNVGYYDSINNLPKQRRITHLPLIRMRRKHCKGFVLVFSSSFSGQGKGRPNPCARCGSVANYRWQRGRCTHGSVLVCAKCANCVSLLVCDKCVKLITHKVC